MPKSGKRPARAQPRSDVASSAERLEAKLREISKRLEEAEARIDSLEGSLEETDGYARGGAGKAVDVEERLDALEGELIERRVLPRT